MAKKTKVAKKDFMVVDTSCNAHDGAPELYSAVNAEEAVQAFLTDFVSDNMINDDPDWYDIQVHELAKSYAVDLKKPEVAVSIKLKKLR
jgi:hypothetical protein